VLIVVANGVVTGERGRGLIAIYWFDSVQIGFFVAVAMDFVHSQEWL